MVDNKSQRALMFASWNLRMQVNLISVVFAESGGGNVWFSFLFLDNFLSDVSSFVTPTNIREYSIHNIRQHVVIFHCFFHLFTIFEYRVVDKFCNLNLGIFQTLLSFTFNTLFLEEWFDRICVFGLWNAKFSLYGEELRQNIILVDQGRSEVIILIRTNRWSPNSIRIWKELYNLKITILSWLIDIINCYNLELIP